MPDKLIDQFKEVYYRITTKQMPLETFIKLIDNIIEDSYRQGVKDAS